MNQKGVTYALAHPVMGRAMWKLDPPLDKQERRANNSGDT